MLFTYPIEINGIYRQMGIIQANYIMDICCFLHETCIYGTEYREIREVLLLLKKKKKKKE